MQRLLLEEPFTRPYLPRTQGDEEALPPLVLELALRKCKQYWGSERGERVSLIPLNRVG